ncbi:hypothetical protein CIW49_06350 [Mycolicibacterium sp. P1-18]|uniref:hypothetical protein n=1 Tax=Mycolicibacterium sp. P1-18 TaxID=2024615 RepID=UPI0011F171CF|nr:hypothetical protein [Mycolicibacterium sp. P1-18]KAA0101116.1 hypothetical protein CIW49_06350 [Mycolicibacterium sp. P1-18]
MDHLEPAPESRRRARLGAAAPTIGAAVEIVGIATSPVIASWLADDYGLVVVGLYFVLAAGVSFAISLVT